MSIPIMHPRVERATPGASVFEQDTRPQPLDDHRFSADVTGRWNGMHGQPMGGYVLAVALQALRREVTFPDLLVVSAFFFKPVIPGPVEVRTELIRAGRRTATAQARLLQNGNEALHATATFTDLSEAHGRTLMFGQPPDLPSPEHTVDLVDPDAIPRCSLADRLDYRVAELPGWRQGQPSGNPTSELWMRLTEGGDDDTIALPFLVDAATTPAMEIGAVSSTTVELTVHIRARPTPGWFACRAATRFVIDGYHEEDFEIWSPDGTLIAQSRQLAILRDPEQSRDAAKCL